MVTVYEAGERARDLVAQILTFSRRGKDEMVPLMLDTIVKETAKLLKSTFPASIVTSCDIAPELPLVFADPTQMHQVLMNLSVNAMHAMPDGGQLHITLRQDYFTNKHCTGCSATLNGSFLHLTLQDSGQGIDTSIQTRIFESLLYHQRGGQRHRARPRLGARHNPQS